jgi:hypothetical protein
MSPEDVIALRDSIIADKFFNVSHEDWQILPDEVAVTVRPPKEKLAPDEPEFNLRDAEKMRVWQAWKQQHEAKIIAERRAAAGLPPDRTKQTDQPAAAAGRAPEATAPTVEPDAVTGAVDIEALATQRRYGKERTPTGIELAQQLAQRVDVPDAVQTLERDTGHKVTPSHRGIEIADPQGVRIATVTSMPQAQMMLMSIRLKQLQEMLG